MASLVMEILGLTFAIFGIVVLDNCGFSMYPDAGREQGRRIVGGWEARTHEFPYQGLLYFEDKFDCGASLVNKRFVLTAAHCVAQFSSNKFSVGFGEQTQSAPPPERRIYKVVQVIIHEGWNNVTIENDIALLRVGEDITFGNSSFPVCPPQSSHNYTGVNATTSGWGVMNTSTGAAADTLRYTNLPMMSHSQCQASQTGIRPGMLCAGYDGENKRDSCSGDSGGPLTVKNAQGRFEQVGIVSWGRGECAGPKPGVYSDVAYYLDWINHKIATFASST